jgi:hypothetical protein
MSKSLPGVPADLLPAGALDTLRPYMDQMTALLGCDVLQATQAHGPDRPAGRQEPRSAWSVPWS